MNSKREKIEDKITQFSMKISSQIHLRSLRDGMSLLMPLFILAGLAILFNYVLLPATVPLLGKIIPNMDNNQTLSQLQTFGNVLQTGTINITGMLMAPAVGFALAKNRDFLSPISASIISLVSFIIMMPLKVSVVPIDYETEVSVQGMLSTTNLGSKAMFAGIIVALLATELYIRLSNYDKLKVKLGDGVPPMVAQSFSTMFPAMITLSIIALISALLQALFSTDLVSLIFEIVQNPMRKINTSLAGYILIYSVGNLLFTFGIHQSVISETLIGPFTLSNMTENMEAFTAGEDIPHIITNAFQAVYPQMGGTGATISLLLAIFLFSKQKTSRDIAKLSLAPGIFEINEPLIFGYPIVYNLPLIFPFVFILALNAFIGYIATSLGFVSHTVAMIPWVTPPLISGYLATAGDWRTVILQAILIILGAVIYLPFMKISERVSKIMAKKNN